MNRGIVPLVRRSFSCPRAHLRGFSLVELLVGLFLGLLLLTGLSALMVQSSGAFRAVQNEAAMVDNGRYVTDLLANEINHVGFFGHYATDPDLEPSGPLPTPCSIDKNTLKSIIRDSLPLRVYEGANTDPTGGCLSNYLRNTDVVVVHRASTVLIAPSALKDNAGRFFIQTDELGTNFTVDQATTDCATNADRFDFRGRDRSTEAQPIGYDSWSDYLDCFSSAAALDLREMLTYIYYLSACDDCSSDGDDLPTLKRGQIISDTSGNVTLQPVTISRNIDNLQVFLNTDSSPYDGDPDSFQISPSAMPSIAAWAHITGAELFLLFRADQETIQGTNEQDRRYLLGPDSTVDANWIDADDGFKRRVFRVQLRLNNLSDRNIES
ncbi:PilW family protein [Rhabdochromatium marinum]|uniref:PilW family protein n=1 Tax=Rhabdochromatium marinum TaxID=48729 RepID=UPI001902DBB2|nr:PilW family protein [Rhabdochromatium marinum]